MPQGWKPLSSIIPASYALVDRFDDWAHRSRARSLLSKVIVTIVGPLVVLTGVAMTVLPGPGIVVIALGLAVMALEYEWARGGLRLMGHTLAKAKESALPKNGSAFRRVLGVAGAGAFFVATCALTTAVTTYVGVHAIV